jgi:hypothetical protein
MLAIYFDKRVGKSVRTALEQFVNHLSGLISIRHKIHVFVCSKLSDENDFFYGQYAFYKRHKCILIEGNLSYIMRKMKCPRSWAITEVLITLAHELKHCELCRKGERQYEEKVQRMAESVYKSALQRFDAHGPAKKIKYSIEQDFLTAYLLAFLKR